MKNHPQQPYEPLMPNPVPKAYWDIITVNLITQLPESDSFNAICMVVDGLTKKAHFYPTVTNKTVAMFVLIDLFGQYLGNQ